MIAWRTMQLQHSLSVILISFSTSDLGVLLFRVALDLLKSGSFAVDSVEVNIAWLLFIM